MNEQKRQYLINQLNDPQTIEVDKSVIRRKLSIAMPLKASDICCENNGRLTLIENYIATQCKRLNIEAGIANKKAEIPKIIYKIRLMCGFADSLDYDDVLDRTVNHSKNGIQCWILF